LGFNSRLTYFFKDKWNSQLRVGYEFLSGDDPDSETDEGWDPLWARWPQWSELYVYTYARETRIAEVNNLHHLGFGWTFEPNNKLEVCTDYHLLFCDENSSRGRAGFSDNGVFRGQLLTALLRYKVNKHISTHLLGEFSFPGDFYSNASNDPAAFLRAQVVFAF